MNFIYNLPIKFNIPVVPFKARTVANKTPQVVQVIDGFATNPLFDRFGTKEQIETIAKSNTRIRELLGKYNIPIEANMVVLNSLKEGHLKNTRIVAAKIYSALPEHLKRNVNLHNLQEAAILHDYGKVLIPESILNKNGKLTDKEREIMELHSELGYELLKNRGLSEKTLNLIKYHHQNLNKNGYPIMNSGFEYGLDTQILTLADKYTALREKRSYKNPFGKYDALELLAKDVQKGLISQEVYTALIKSV